MSDERPTMQQYPDGGQWHDERAWPPAEPPPAPPEPPRRRRASRVGLMVMLGLITLLVTNSLGSNVGTMAAARVNAPIPVDAPPQVPEDFPDGAQRYLPDLTVDEIAVDWLDASGTWTCEEEDPPPNAKQGLFCQPKDEFAAFAFTIRLAYDDPEQVAEVSAQCDSQVGRDGCVTFFSRVTAAVFDQQQGKKARRWVRRNIENDRATVIDGVHLWMPLDATRSSLYIRPAA